MIVFGQAKAKPPRAVPCAPAQYPLSPRRQFHRESTMLTIRRFSAITAILAATAAHAQQRLPTIPPGEYSAEPKKAAADFEAARKVPVFGPFEPMMHRPTLMTQARGMGDYLRYPSAVGNTLSERAILVAAREWTQDCEWHVHSPIAIHAGIAQEVVDAIADGRRLPRLP
jgi:4-carboxymuconolactone decarboxylase